MTQGRGGTQGTRGTVAFEKAPQNFYEKESRISFVQVRVLTNMSDLRRAKDGTKLVSNRNCTDKIHAHPLIKVLAQAVTNKFVLKKPRSPPFPLATYSLS